MSEIYKFKLSTFYTFEDPRNLVMINQIRSMKVLFFTIYNVTLSQKTTITA